MTEDRLLKAKELHRHGWSAGRIARAVGVSRTTIINHYAKLEADGDET
jgi:AcrR family transcriptional regulator